MRKLTPDLGLAPNWVALKFLENGSWRFFSCEKCQSKSFIQLAVNLHECSDCEARYNTSGSNRPTQVTV